MRADIHDGQEHERSIHGPDTEAQDQSPPSLTSGLQHTAGPYKLGQAYRSVMGAHFPAMTLVQVGALVEDEARVEIEATAVVPK